MTLIFLPLVTLSVLMVSWIFSVVIEVVCMSAIWPEEGSQHSRAMLMTEMQYIHHGLPRSLYATEPVVMLSEALQGVNQTFEQLGLYPLMRRLSLPPDDTDSRFIGRLKLLYQDAEDYFRAAVYVTQLFCVRVVIILLSFPIFVLVGIGAMLDGLVQRDLRKFGGGNESAWLYHKVKRSLNHVIVMTLLAYLSFPISIHPNLIFIPAALLFGVLLFITTSRFKKYI